MTSELDIPPERDLPPEARRARRADLLRNVRADLQPSDSGNGHRTRRSRKWGMAAAGIAAVLALVLALPAILPSGSGGGPQPANAAEALSEAADAAALQPALSLSPGQYLYSKTQSWGDKYAPYKWGYIDTSTSEVWTAADGSGRIIMHYTEQVPSTPSPGQTTPSSGPPEIYTGTDSCTYDEPGRLTPVDLSGMSTDVEALRQVVASIALRGKHDYPEAKQSDMMLDRIRQTLGAGYGPPEVRAALYRVAAELPGVELLGQVKDPLGRVGTAVDVTWLGIRNELIFNPATGAVLAQRYVQVDPPVYTVSPSPGIGVNADGIDDPGTVLSWTAYEDARVVDSMPPSGADHKLSSKGTCD